LGQIGGILKKLGPLGTAIGIATAISLLAEGEVWAAAKELVFAIPIIGDILDIGSSLWGWITGDDDDGDEIDVDDYLVSGEEVKSALKDINIIAVTSDDPSTSSGASGESRRAGQASGPGFQRLVDLGGAMVSITPVKPGTPRDPWTIARLPNGPWMQWDEYLLLDLVILGKKVQLLPTSLGLTFQFGF
jgi:hypothetical protein